MKTATSLTATTTNPTNTTTTSGSAVKYDFKCYCRVCLEQSENMLSIFTKDDDNQLLAQKIAICGGIEITSQDSDDINTLYPDKICPKCMAFLNIAHKFRTTCKNSDELLCSFVLQLQDIYYDYDGIGNNDDNFEHKKSLLSSITPSFPLTLTEESLLPSSTITKSSINNKNKTNKNDLGELDDDGTAIIIHVEETNSNEGNDINNEVKYQMNNENGIENNYDDNGEQYYELQALDNNSTDSINVNKGIIIRKLNKINNHNDCNEIYDDKNLITIKNENDHKNHENETISEIYELYEDNNQYYMHEERLLDDKIDDNNDDDDDVDNDDNNLNLEINDDNNDHSIIVIKQAKLNDNKNLSLNKIKNLKRKQNAENRRLLNVNDENNDDGEDDNNDKNDEDYKPNSTDMMMKKRKTRSCTSNLNSNYNRYHHNNVNNNKRTNDKLMDNNEIQKTKNNNKNKKSNSITKIASEQKLNNFICEICGNKYKKKVLLDSHMRWHSDDKQYKCEVCGREFTINFQLTRHMRVHTGDKPYTCNVCGRKFSDYSTCKKHKRTHTDERPFKCEICGKGFNYSHVLRIHMTVHTGEKPYSCNQCHKKFAQPHHLKAHLATQAHKGGVNFMNEFNINKTNNDSNNKQQILRIEESSSPSFVQHEITQIHVNDNDDDEQILQDFEEMQSNNDIQKYEVITITTYNENEHMI